MELFATNENELYELYVHHLWDSVFKTKLIVNFHLLTTNYERMKFILDLESKNKFKIKQMLKGKCEKNSFDNKEKGNDLFKRGQFSKALHCYNEGVISAPIVKDEECSNIYSLCLGNRSAVFFRLGEYHKAIEDIDEALFYHYRKDLKYKLYVRKGKCLQKLKCYTEATNSFNDALAVLNICQLEESEKNKLEATVLKLIAETPSCNFNDEENNEANDVSSPSKLSVDLNEHFKEISSKISIEYSNDVGRHSVAAEDIDPGDVLCMEKPYAAVLDSHHFKSHCHKCFTRLFSVFPCNKCTEALFCSIKCRDASYFHTIECNFLTYLWCLKIPRENCLALRMLTQFPFMDFLRNFEHLKDDEFPKDRLDANQESFNMFKFVYNLCHHEDQTPPPECLKYAMLSSFFLNLLNTTEYFKDPKIQQCCEALNINPEIFAGTLLMRFIAIRKFNTHVVSELALPSSMSVDGALQVELGRALYPSFTLFNHSCSSPLARFFNGTELVAISTRPMQKGDKVPDTYGYFFADTDCSFRPFRRENIKRSFWFECNCEACANKWPTLKNMENDILKCTNCLKELDFDFDDKSEFVCRCANCHEKINIGSYHKKIKTCLQLSNEKVDLATKIDYNEAEKDLINIIKQLDSVLLPQSPSFVITWKKLMKVLLLNGNLSVQY